MSANNRKFNIDDAKLFEHASTVVSFLSEDINDFAIFDSTFGQSTIDTLQLALTSAVATKPDSVIKSEQAELTDAVKEKMKACKGGYKTVAYFVRKVFKDNMAVEKEFGLGEYKKIRGNQGRMIMFIRSLADTARNYQAELITGGMSKNVVDSLPALHQELFDAKNSRDIFRKQRGKLTRERVKKLNLLYDKLLPISNAARIIYAQNPAQQNKYTLPGRLAKTREG